MSGRRLERLISRVEAKAVETASRIDIGTRKEPRKCEERAEKSSLLPLRISTHQYYSYTLNYPSRPSPIQRDPVPSRESAVVSHPPPPSPPLQTNPPYLGIHVPRNPTPRTLQHPQAMPVEPLHTCLSVIVQAVLPPCFHTPGISNKARQTKGKGRPGGRGGRYPGSRARSQIARRIVVEDAVVHREGSFMRSRPRQLTTPSSAQTAC